MSKLTVQLNSLLCLGCFLSLFLLGLLAIYNDMIYLYYINMFVVFFSFYRLLYFYFKTKELEEK